jgi:RimJ/RimL family protein N-acetyltransferase
VHTFRLHNGTEVAIRPIHADDRPALQAAHARLSPETQYNRFLAAKPHLSDADARYLVEIDGSDHFALVATPAEDPGLIIAVARFVRLPDDPDVAEFAIVVGDRYQRQGLAAEVLRRLADAALERGMLRFRATTLAHNHALHHLVRKFAGGSAGETPRGPIDEIEFDLSPRSQGMAGIRATDEIRGTQGIRASRGIRGTHRPTPAMIAGCPGG